MDFAALAVTFGTIFLVELPDKTFLATMVLSTRYRPLFVWIGVGLAFTVQTVIAVSIGAGIANLIPRNAILIAVVVMFSIGAVVLWRESLRGDEDDAGVAQTKPLQWWQVIGTSFLILLTAEIGDLSQLLTISMGARYDAPVSVFAGSLAALLTVSALAVLVGKTLLTWIKPTMLQRIGAVVCTILAVVTLVELVR